MPSTNKKNVRILSRLLSHVLLNINFLSCREKSLSMNIWLEVAVRTTQEEGLVISVTIGDFFSGHTACDVIGLNHQHPNCPSMMLFCF